MEEDREGERERSVGGGGLRPKKRRKRERGGTVASAAFSGREGETGEGGGRHY